MTNTEWAAPLPLTSKEVSESRAQALPDGVFLVLKNKRITGLHVFGGAGQPGSAGQTGGAQPGGAGQPGGVAVLDRRDGQWQPQQPITKVTRAKIIRSRIRIRFADGNTIRVRPFKPGLKGMVEVGLKDSMGAMPTTSSDPRYDAGADVFATAFLLVLAVLLFPVSLFFLVREVSGTSARAKEAAIVVTRLRAVTSA